jgi:hypothetical protein
LIQITVNALERALPLAHQTLDKQIQSVQLPYAAHNLHSPPPRV